MNNIKFSYADIVKGVNKPLEQNIDTNNSHTNNSHIQKHIPIPISKPIKYGINLNGSYSNRISFLLNKILKSEKNNKYYEKTIIEIQKAILNTSNSFDDIVKTMVNINNILNKNKFRKLNEVYKENPNHDFVSSNIAEIVKKYNSSNLDVTNFNIVDIGGGEGDVIKHIGQTLNIPSTNLYCVEQEKWSEEYIFNNDINYLFWNNVDLNLPNESIDLFLLIVSMHHMNDEIINNVLKNISKQIKKDGLIIIKEHDSVDENVLGAINWEHHMYHIVTMSNEKLTVSDLENYMITYISNFKSKKNFDDIFKSHNFIGVAELNRQFKPLISHDNLNATNLYWKIYKKNTDLVEAEVQTNLAEAEVQTDLAEVEVQTNLAEIEVQTNLVEIEQTI